MEMCIFVQPLWGGGHLYAQFGLNSYIIDYTGGREGEHGGEKKKQTYGIVRETFDQTDG